MDQFLTTRSKYRHLVLDVRAKVLLNVKVEKNLHWHVRSIEVKILETMGFEPEKDQTSAIARKYLAKTPD